MKNLTKKYRLFKACKDFRIIQLSNYRTETMNDGSGEIPYYPLEPVAVTKENLDEVIIEGGFHQREDVYLNID